MSCEVIRLGSVERTVEPHNLWTNLRDPPRSQLRPDPLCATRAHKIHVGCLRESDTDDVRIDWVAAEVVPV
jgi:hypothetical protein